MRVTTTDFTDLSRTIAWGANGGRFDIVDPSNVFTVSSSDSDILDAMRDRGQRAIREGAETLDTPANELRLAQDLRAAMRDGRVHYVEAKGDPRGPQYGGGQYRLFDMRNNPNQ
jgi:hypothetical protein